jgi:hypothetical protein
LKKRLLLLVSFVALAFLSYSLTACLQLPVARADNEQASIEAADSSIRQAFAVVLEAEKAGGNVTQLLAELNVAGSRLADAENAYRSGKMSEVVAIAGNASQIAENARNEALNLRDVSAANSQNEFWLTITFSAIGAVVFIFALMLGWRRFSSAYSENLLKKKPEVVADET